MKRSNPNPLFDALEPRVLFDGDPPRSETIWNHATQAPIAVADLTGDGHADLLLRRPAGFALKAGNGNGIFGAARVVLDSEQSRGLLYRTAAVGRFNDDPALDVVLVRRINDFRFHIILLTNDGAGNFTIRQQTRRFDTIQTISTASLSGAAERDSVLCVCTDTSRSGYRLRALRFGDAGRIASARLIAVNAELAYEQPRASDLNRDGFDDIVIPRTGPASGGTFQALINQRDGTFTGLVIGSIRASISSTLVGDATGDGVPDVVVTTFGYNFDSSTVRVWLMQGAINQSGSLSYSAARVIHSEEWFNEDEARLWLVGIGDTNGDSVPDIAIERANLFFNSRATSTMLLLENDALAAHGFSQRTPIPDRMGASVFDWVGFSAGDIDGDGTLEIFRLAPNALEVWWTTVP